MTTICSEYPVVGERWAVMSVEFRLLGEVEALVDGRRLDIGHARQRCVLACLLVDVNRPVSTDQLIDRVWSDEPPHRARNAVAAYVSRLRHSFSGTDGTTIARGPVGYTLSADAQLVDLHRFRTLVATARATTNADEADTRFGEAFALWRGEPFAGIETPWVNTVRNSLDTERLSAALDRNDAALRAGRHTELLGELAAALLLHPLDERLAGQLILAQYRSGRQAAALETYRQMRERLVDELGIDPGAPLRALHQEILEGPPPEAKIAPKAAPAPAPPLVESAPPSIPRRGTRFVGRTDDLARVMAALHAGPLVTLTGVGGVGKTRLAFEAAERVTGDFADGAFVCELAPLDDGATVPHAVLTALRLPQRHGLDVAETVIEFLRPRRLLLVVDNCEHLLDAAAVLLDRIIGDCPGVALVATSREPLGVEGERLLPVDPLPESDATELFAERARAIRPEFDLALEPVGAVAEICRRLDGVPLAIELAAARMRVMSSLDVARRLDRLRLLSGGARGAHPRQQSVSATIDWSYRLLGEPEQALFAQLAVFAGSFDLEAAHGVCAAPGDSEDDTLDLLTGLVDKSMVTVRSGYGTTRYSLLETLRAYGRDRLREKGTHDQYAVRHARYFIELVERAASAIYGPDEQMWIERLAPDAGNNFTSPDFDNLRAAFERAMADRDAGLALRLVTSLPELLHLRIGYHSLGWVERAIELADAEHPLFPAAVGTAARAAWVLGQFGRARALAELAAGREPEPGTPYLVYPRDVVADIALYGGDPHASLAHYESELSNASRVADPVQRVWILYSITISHDALGTPEAGLAEAEEALRVAEPTANPTTLSMARCALGRALKRSDPQRALLLFEEARELAAAVENNWLTGISGMEAAAIRTEHGEPGATARMFVDVLNHWAKAGPGTGALHWLTMRYAARLLERLGADEEAAALHRAVVRAVEDSSSSSAARGAVDGALSATEALALARTSLQRYC